MSHNIQADHSYCLATDQIRENVIQFTPVVNHRRALKKERQRTFRLKKRVQQMMKSARRGATESLISLDFLQEPVKSFFESQLRNAPGHRSARGRRWDYADKILPLSLYHKSPSTYQLYQSIFTLPSISLLRRWLCNVEVRPGFPTKIFALWKDRVAGMSESDRVCIVSFDEMSLQASRTILQKIQLKVLRTLDR